MKMLVIALLLATNQKIDIDGFLRDTKAAAEHRATRRLSEEDFLRMSQEPGTIVLDARSRDKYDELHVRGAVNLSFPDVNEASLAQLIPSKETRILIYCNNNFVGNQSAFADKRAPASLNHYTYTTLYTYGYRNIYELEPLLDVRTTKLQLVSSRTSAGSSN